MVLVNVKWGKQMYKDVEMDKSKSVVDFKNEIFKLTNVPVERQKLMGKWKGILKDDVNLAELKLLKEHSQVLLMGTADVIEAPKQKTVFLEDMTDEQKAETGVLVPCGLQNLGNTCYMNATLQCLRYVPEFRDALKEYTTHATIDPAHNFTNALKETYYQMDSSVETMVPMAFVNALRRCFPQYAQTTSRGAYMQQDSDEFVSTLFSTLSQKLDKPCSSLSNLGNKANVIDALFGMDMEETIECTETEKEPKLIKHEKALKLVCNISKDTNHLAEGVQLGLTGSIEKNSEELQRNAMWKKSLKINELPKYLCVQFMRFYWKLTPESRDHTGVKCKMMRPMSFPLVLDTFDFCSDDLKAVLKVSRDKNADKILNEFKESKDNAESTPMEVQESKAEESAKIMAKEPHRSPGLGLPKDFMGHYELFAVVTHKGRSADSGHYIGWARGEGDDWFCFDDDDVSPCKSEDIQKLKGGGDWHMNYLTFYRAKN